MLKRVCLSLVVCLAVLPPPCMAGKNKAGTGAKEKSVQSKPMSRREVIQALLGCGTYYKQKGQYQEAKESYEGMVDINFRMIRQQNLVEGMECSQRITRIEKLVELEGARADWSKKLTASKNRIAEIRKTNFDYWLIGIRGYVAAGEMAEVLGETDEALRLYSSALGCQYFLSKQDLSDMPEEAMADYREWGSWPSVKLKKLGLDVDKCMEILREEEGKKTESPISPYL